HHKLPTNKSTEPVPGMPGRTWQSLYSAGLSGTHGLEKGRTLSRILEKLRAELIKPPPDLCEADIVAAARKFYGEHGTLPTAHSSEAVPGMPDETWSKIQSAGLYGERGLAKGRTLAVILEPLRQELEPEWTVTEVQIEIAAIKYFRKHHEFP